ncbi:hypothetical protein DAPK24_028560 [Pichia kluyveri]|uniref:Spp2/MOS2 G-patch domain-containing protein n=1 Tax=Pichia kluyveri TaxID=36015 RepID=A0AAV5R4U5_PICKL|nr:hypothetical protein DAPK24_028560 [Pichia kluyveri]
MTSMESVQDGGITKPKVKKLSKFSLKSKKKQNTPIKRTEINALKDGEEDVDNNTTADISISNIADINTSKDVTNTPVEPATKLIITPPPPMSQSKVAQFFSRQIQTEEKAAGAEDISDAENSNINNIIGAEPPNEESYKEVPVNDFGFALLRGMGWNEEEESVHRREQKKMYNP